jgi:hypothetical protein
MRKQFPSLYDQSQVTDSEERATSRLTCAQTHISAHSDSPSNKHLTFTKIHQTRIKITLPMAHPMRIGAHASARRVPIFPDFSDFYRFISKINTQKAFVVRTTSTTAVGPAPRGYRKIRHGMGQLILAGTVN